MTDSLQALKELALAATPGPWEALTDTPHYLVREQDDDSGEADVCEPFMANDAAYIAAMNPAVVLKLIEVVEVARHRKEVAAVYKTYQPDVPLNIFHWLREATEAEDAALDALFAKGGH